jgi:16S rRNA (guanine(966)-N(2))-methyltransferase RsmD
LDLGLLRIIAGKYRGRNLKSPPSLEVRPTSDRLRETLFNVIAPRIVGSRFLDLCAGSGAVGIEALSRGAGHVSLVDRSQKMCALIQSNLDLCRIDKGEAEVIQAEAEDYLRRANARKARPEMSWDIVFFDPPYANDYLDVLNALGAADSSLLTEGALVIVEHHHKKALPEMTKILKCSRVLKQGESALSFFEVNV